MKREIQQSIESHIRKHKILLLKGPRKSGRTQLIKQALENPEDAVLLELGDKKIRRQLEDLDAAKIRTLLAGKSTLILHEAQYLAQLQQIIELVLFEDLPLSLICICSFEPLIDDVLYEALSLQGLLINCTTPTFKEIAQEEGLVNFENALENRLIYGNYHHSSESEQDIKSRLNERIELLLNEPISAQDRINKGPQLKKLLQQLAFSIGEHVSYNEIAVKCGLDNETVERYIKLLEKCFVLISLPVYQTGKRYELKKAHTIYFLDNGIRNAAIQNFNALDIRNDAEALWRNWLIAERIKRAMNKQEKIQAYFWVTHTRQWVDYLEEKADVLYAYQLLWNKKDKRKLPASFTKNYPEARGYQINKSTYWSFLNKD